MHLWAGDDVCLSGSARGGIPQLRGARESDKCTRRNGVELVQTRGAEGTNERHGALRESRGSRVSSVQFSETIATQNGGKRKGPIETYPKFWNLNPLTAVMVVTTPPSKGVRSRKRKREVEELNSPSADAVSEKNLRETDPMVLARWKTTAYKGSSEPRRLAEVVKEMEVPTSLAMEEDFRPQKASTKRGSTNGQTWEVDVGKECIASEHQAIGKQVASDPLEKNATRITARPWWMTLETRKELEECLRKLDCGVSLKRRNWATQQKVEINKLELGSWLKRTWQNLLRDYFEEAMRTPSSALPLMANPFVRTAGQLTFGWSLVGIELEVLTSHDKLKLGNNSGVEREFRAGKEGVRNDTREKNFAQPRPRVPDGHENELGMN